MSAKRFELRVRGSSRGKRTDPFLHVGGLWVGGLWVFVEFSTIFTIHPYLGLHGQGRCVLERVSLSSCEGRLSVKIELRRERLPRLKLRRSQRQLVDVAQFGEEGDNYTGIRVKKWYHTNGANIGKKGFKRVWDRRGGRSRRRRWDCKFLTP